MSELDCLSVKKVQNTAMLKSRMSLYQNLKQSFYH